MKNVETNGTQGSGTSNCHGLVKKISVSAIGAALLLTPLGITTARADTSAPVTQFQYLQTIAQISGASGQFSSSSTPADYAHWAESKGISPTGSWQPGATLTKSALAQTLTQVLHLDPSKLGTDYPRILLREGIDISGVGDQVTKDSLVGVIDQPLVSTFIVPGGPKITAAPPTPNHPGTAGVGKITICHKGHIIITISQNALDAHLAHGDTIGACIVTTPN